jgi:hypothetical protein
VYSGSITVDKALNCQKIPDGWEIDCSLNAFKNCSLNECKKLVGHVYFHFLEAGND